MAQLPDGTVTFLFTDLEGSTRLWEEQPEAMRAALAVHDGLVRDAIEAHGGHVVKGTGDGAFAVFGSAPDGVAAAVAAQRALERADWPAGVALRVRMGLHVGQASAQDGDYFGPDVNRTARLTSVAHGGQIVCSRPVVELVRDRFTLVDLGEHWLRDLQSSVHVFQVDSPGFASEFPPLRSLNALPGNLPRQVTTFVGRETQIGSLTNLVCQSSLVTLTGVGGVGKTRLALQVAAEAVAEFRDGAWLCELAPVADPGAVWETLAASLRVQPFPGRSLHECVLEYLAAKRLLLVLDNCEHLLDAAARQVDAITQRCPRVSVLATSREGLALAGERIIAVASLTVPRGDADVDALKAAEAVQLFADRAAAARNDFVLTDRNVSAVAVLCRRLDGIPLAIELAAARVRSMSPDDLVARLDQRFKLLTRGSRASLERHQTLRSTIDWSYDLLEPSERHALDCLSVFAGGCDLAAAEAVLADDVLDVSDVVDALTQLVDKSLVVADNTDDGVRYRLFESIRQYAQERLEASGDTETIRRRHADHYVAIAEEAGPHLRARGQLAWANAAVRDTDNFRAVLDWAVERPSAEHALRLVAPFTVTGMTIGDTAIDWADTASTIPGADEHPAFPVVATWAAFGATMGGDFEHAEARIAAAEEARRLLDVPNPSVLRARAVLALFSGNMEQAQRDAGTWVELARRSGDSYELAHALIMLGGALGRRADPTAAIAAVDEAVGVARDAGILSALSIGLTVLALVLPIEETERILPLCDEAIDIGAQIGDRISVASATGTKGWTAANRGEWRTALRAAVDSAEQRLELGDVVSLPHSLHLAGAAFCSLGHPVPAAMMLGKADALAIASPPDWGVRLLTSINASLLEALGEQRLTTLASRGAALELDEAIAYLHDEADLALHEE